MPIFNWSQTAATNATADATISWSEGQAPSSVNDSARAMMAAVAKWRDDNDGSLVTGGTSTAFTLTTNSVYTTLALLDGHKLTFKVSATSGAAPTLNVDGLGAKAINHTTGVALATGALVSGSTYTAIYRNSTTEFILEGEMAAIAGAYSMTGNVTVGGTLGVTGVATLTAVPVFTAGIASATATTQAASDNSTKVATTAYADRVVSGVIAAQSDQETATSTTTLVTPGRQQFHPSACKCFGMTTGGGSPVLHANSYNVTSITDAGTGILTVTIGTDFSSANYIVVSTVTSSTSVRNVTTNAKAAGSVDLKVWNSADSNADPSVGWDWAFFGDQ